MVRASPQHSSEYSSKIAGAHAYTLKKENQNKGKRKGIHKPVPEERPTDAAGEEKSANPPIRSVLRKRQNINSKQTSPGCRSTIVSVPSVSVVQEVGRGGRWRELGGEHLTSVQCFHLLHSQGTAPKNIWCT